MACDLSDFFEEKGGVYFMRAKDGEVFPVLFCPLCGERIDYDKRKEAVE